MTYTTCAECQSQVPVGESSTCDGRIICDTCLESMQDGGAEFEEEIQNIDPTICGFCGSDNGEDELQRDRGLPICSTCYASLVHRPFPGWVKAFAVVIAAVVVAGMVINARFFTSEISFRRAVSEYKRGMLDEAVADMSRAARLVPEAADLAGLADYFRGVNLLAKDKSAEALPYLETALKANPSNTFIQRLVYSAQIGANFDKKDYSGMYAVSKKMLELTPADPIAHLQVASAAACLFAATGENQYQQEAVSIIASVQNSASAQDKARVEEYVRRIRYRLQSRQIIDVTEYYRRFPEQKTEVNQ